MPADFLEQRVESLEHTVNGPRGLAVKLDQLQSELHDFRSDFLQFKDEVRGEFSALRSEVHGEVAALRNELRAGDEDTRAQMRLLHEEVISRLALLQEGLNGQSGGTRSRRRT